MEIRVYKIFNPKTGLFSQGGSHNRWSKKGKTWNKIVNIKSHLKMLDDYGNSSQTLKTYKRDNCEVIILIHKIEHSEEINIPITDLL